MADTATKIPFAEAAAPSTPAANKVVVYAKADGLMYSKDDAGVETLMSGGATGAVATDAIWDAAGDLVQGTGANTGAKLSAGTAGMFLKSAGAAAANLWAFPPGYELDYAQVTSATNITATTEAGADTVITGAAIAYDGSTIVIIEFFTPFLQTAAGNANLTPVLYDGSSSIGPMTIVTGPDATNAIRVPCLVRRRITPSNATHTYSIRAYASPATGVIHAGTGASTSHSPAYMRITKV